MPKLGVNIDHVATLREARKGVEPDPVFAAVICELAGASSVVVHLREDRRHINERDLKILRQLIQTRLNLEMSINKEIVNIACKVRPDQSTLVPERRREITTEGGLDVVANKNKIKGVVKLLKARGIVTSLFIDPEKKQIDAAKAVGADFVELHTGRYASSRQEKEIRYQLDILIDSANYAINLGLRVNAGHGLNYQNVRSVARIIGIEELNIGHSIISRAVFVGINQAVREMLDLIRV
jgi:pyridoxine 5-phosphate synthase